MFEITIEIPGLVEAINSLAGALYQQPLSVQLADVEMKKKLGELIYDTPPSQPQNISTPVVPVMPSVPAPINPTVSAAGIATPPVAPSIPQQIPVAPPTVPAPVMPPVNPPATIPTAPPKEYTIADFQLALAPLIDAGKRQAITDLCLSLGAASLMEVPKERYNDLAAGLRQLGGRI